MTESRLEKGLYSWFLNGELISVIHSHVDDLCWAYKKCAVARDMISKLSKVLYLKRSGASFTYCGRQITITPTEIRVCMAAACRECEEIPIRPERRRQRDSPVTPSEKSSFRKLLGNAQWCTGQLRLDCACEVNRLAQKVEKATVEDLILLNKAAERLRTSAERSLVVRRGMLDMRKADLICFGDASFADLLKRNLSSAF